MVHKLSTWASYVAFLRGVSPGKPSMAELRECLETDGFRNVRTVLSSGNVILDFTGSEAQVEARMEQSMLRAFGKVYYPVVRSAAYLGELLSADPFSGYEIPAGAKRVVTFLRDPIDPHLPRQTVGGAMLVCAKGREAFTAYVPTAEGPVFMKLIESALGKLQTTRTWETVQKCALAGNVKL